MAADADVLVLLDGDLGATAAEAGTLLEPVLAGAADMTIATLPKPPASGGFGLVKGLARWGIRRLSGFEPTAPLSGQRALSRAAWEAATPFATGYGVEVGLTVRAARAGHAPPRGPDHHGARGNRPRPRRIHAPGTPVRPGGRRARETRGRQACSSGDERREERLRAVHREP